jgi:cell division protein FtsB
MTPARWIAVAVLIAAAVFAYAGGTYSVPNYRALRREEAAAVALLKQLTRDVDSLRAYRDSLATNPAVQEREARGTYGMVRPGEITFTIIWPDTVKRDSTRTP